MEALAAAVLAGKAFCGKLTAFGAADPTTDTGEATVGWAVGMAGVAGGATAAGIEGLAIIIDPDKPEGGVTLIWPVNACVPIIQKKAN